jgi:hypothetical protein
MKVCQGKPFVRLEQSATLLANVDGDQPDKPTTRDTFLDPIAIPWQLDQAMTLRNDHP